MWQRLEKEQRELQQKQQDLQQKQQNLQQKQQDLRQKQQDLQQEQQALQKEQQALQKEQQALQQGQKVLQQEKQTLQQSQQDLKQEQQALELDQKDLQLDQEALQQDQKALQQDQKALEQDQKALQLDQQALQPDQQALQPDQKALQPDQKALQQEKQAPELLPKPQKPPLLPKLQLPQQPEHHQEQQPPKQEQQLPKQGLQPPKQEQQPPKQEQQPPKQGLQPPKQEQQPPKQGQQPPKQEQQPPKQGLQPPKPEQQPPKPGQQPPKPGQQPPKPGQQPPKPGQQLPKPGQQLPKQASRQQVQQSPDHHWLHFPPKPNHHHTQLLPKHLAYFQIQQPPHMSTHHHTQLLSKHHLQQPPKVSVHYQSQHPPKVLVHHQAQQPPKVPSHYQSQQPPKVPPHQQAQQPPKVPPHLQMQQPPKVVLHHVPQPLKVTVHHLTQPSPKSLQLPAYHQGKQLSHPQSPQQSAQQLTHRQLRQPYQQPQQPTQQLSQQVAQVKQRPQQTQLQPKQQQQQFKDQDKTKDPVLTEWQKSKEQQKEQNKKPEDKKAEDAPQVKRYHRTLPKDQAQLLFLQYDHKPQNKETSKALKKTPTSSPSTSKKEMNTKTKKSDGAQTPFNWTLALAHDSAPQIRVISGSSSSPCTPALQRTGITKNENLRLSKENQHSYSLSDMAIRPKTAGQDDVFSSISPAEDQPPKVPERTTSRFRSKDIINQARRHPISSQQPSSGGWAQKPKSGSKVTGNRQWAMECRVTNRPTSGSSRHELPLTRVLEPLYKNGERPPPPVQILTPGFFRGKDIRLFLNASEFSSSSDEIFSSDEEEYGYPRHPLSNGGLNFSRRRAPKGQEMKAKSRGVESKMTSSKNKTSKSISSSTSSFTSFFDPRLLQFTPPISPSRRIFGSCEEKSGFRRRKSRKTSVVNVNPINARPHSDSPEIRKYKKKFSSEVLCAALWGVNLLVGTEKGLWLLDRSGQGRVYSLINRRRFQQIDVLEGLNVLITISGKKNKLRVYYLSWLRNKILRNDPEMGKRQGWISVGDLEGCVHYKVVKYERIKFLVVALRNSVEVYAWAPKPYHKFMAFKSFPSLYQKPLAVDLTVENGQRLKVIYGSVAGFHAIDVDSGMVYDLYLPTHIPGTIQPHTIIILPNTSGTELLLTYEDEGVYVDIYGHFTKESILQWGETPACVAYLQSNQVMGWGEKAIELRSVEAGNLEGVFMHKKSQKLKFLCERNDKVFFASVQSGSSQIYFMTLGQNTLFNW
uniref:non-specific serine/threonine protein kinase n=1 Tax=Sarcophilus harrisii TaxID=9305 RepID=A0A7N4Q1B9_SARHA